MKKNRAVSISRKNQSKIIFAVFYCSRIVKIRETKIPLARIIRSYGTIGGKLTKLGLAIPQQSSDFKTFCGQIKNNEVKYRNKLNGS
jgi:hypothetical protein